MSRDCEHQRRHCVWFDSSKAPGGVHTFAACDVWQNADKVTNSMLHYCLQQFIVRWYVHTRSRPSHAKGLKLLWLKHETERVPGLGLVPRTNAISVQHTRAILHFARPYRQRAVLVQPLGLTVHLVTCRRCWHSTHVVNVTCAVKPFCKSNDVFVSTLTVFQLDACVDCYCLYKLSAVYNR